MSSIGSSETSSAVGVGLGVAVAIDVGIDRWEEEAFDVRVLELGSAIWRAHFGGCTGVVGELAEFANSCGS